MLLASACAQVAAMVDYSASPALNTVNRVVNKAVTTVAVVSGLPVGDHRQAAKYRVPRFCPFVLTLLSSSSFLAGNLRSVVETFIAAAICSMRWPLFALMWASKASVVLAINPGERFAPFLRLAFFVAADVPGWRTLPD